MNSLEQRIFSSNEWGLIALLHESFITRLDESISCIESDPSKDLSSQFEHMRDILAELIVQFKGDDDLGAKLREIYLYLINVITDGFRTKNIAKFLEARRIIEPVMNGFQELSKEQSPKSVSGYTYGKKDLWDSPTSSFDSKQ